MPQFVRGLAQAGAHVIGLGDQPESALPPLSRASLHAYVQGPSFADEQGLVDLARRIAARTRIDLVESLWEPTMLVAARMREALSLPGMSVAETLPFRDKEHMKVVLDR